VPRSPNTTSSTAPVVRTAIRRVTTSELRRLTWMHE
jgi:hypothetical protein